MPLSSQNGVNPRNAKSGVANKNRGTLERVNYIQQQHNFIEQSSAQSKGWYFGIDSLS